MAEIGLLPNTRLEPLTVIDAAAVVPAGARVTQPNEIFPAANVTVPVGAVVPLAGATVTLNTVEAFWTMLAGLAVAEAVLAISGADIVTAIDVETDAVKLPLPP
jgi:hypothetical protein